MKIVLSDNFKKIVLIFLIWRAILFIALFTSLKFVPLGYKDRFLGGGPTNYSIFPELFAWANFDGEHYLSIAIFGYRWLEQAFFPVYPLLISFFAHPFYQDLLSSLISSAFVGLLISNTAFLLALITLWRLVKMDYPEKIAYWTIILLVLFPTSFYFGSMYNESLFLLLSVSSFYYARKNNWFIAAVLGMASSATRIFGLILLPSLIIEAWQKKLNKRKMIFILLVPMGLIIYMVYQWITVGDPLMFYRLQKLVGEQHQSGITLLPQVYYRYIKMLLTTDLYNPIYQTLILEFVVGILFFVLPIYAFFKKMRLSYVLYALVGFLLPSIQGSFSSVPRYVIVFFPSFIAMAFLFERLNLWFKILSIFTLLILLIAETTLFLRGYWIA